MKKEVVAIYSSEYVLARLDSQRKECLQVASVDLQYKRIVAKLQQHEKPQTKESYTLGTDSLLLYKNRVYVPNV